MATGSSERVEKHRQSLRAAGLRPVQLWVPDTRSVAFAAECRLQSERVHVDPRDGESTDWLEQVADTDGWR